jgi:hypothetical protein
LEREVLAPEDVAPADRSSFGRLEVAAGDVIHVDDIQGGVDETRNAPVEELEDSSARRRGAAITGADRGGGLDEYHR